MLDAVMRPDTLYLYSIWVVGSAMAVGAIGSTLVFAFVVGRLLHIDTRRRHNVLTGSIFSIVGVTYAVLLAFVAMLAWQNYDAAQAATNHEAALLLDAVRATTGLSEPARSQMRAELVGYGEAVREIEWPAQADGRASRAGEPSADRADTIVSALKPTDIGQGNLQAAAIAALTRLRDARDTRIAASEAAIPGIVWFVVIIGGAITLVFATLLGAWHTGLHLTLASLLSLSGVLILLMIVALSHPFRGDFRITSDPFAKVLAQMRKP